jgi:hypothetical protein
MIGGVLVRSSSIVAVIGIVAAVVPGTAGCACDAARPDQPRIAELWVDPGNVSRRDAFHGPGGPASLPAADGEFEVTDVDTTGFSGGYTVTEGSRRWDVKIGREAQPEVVLSRVLWLVGYHQPIVHFLPTWRRKGEPGREQLSARFRLQSDHETEGEWDWRDNPFTGRREMKGLVTINLLFNNWDFKTSNNRIYEVEPGTAGIRRWFVVQDLGASLGKSGWPIGNRNDVEGFESQRFITGVEHGIVQFDYSGRHRDVLDDLSAADVLWACRLLARITDRQWVDVFRAAAYPADVSERYRAHVKSKIAEGLALAPPSRTQR